jgi:hypothetical protein
MPFTSRVVTRENLSSLVADVLAGRIFKLAPTPPTGYTRQFQHKDWIDFVDPVQAGGDNGFNQRFHALENEFDLISTAITSVDSAVTDLQNASPAIGITIATLLSNGASIPIPSGFQASETKFFAFVKQYTVDLSQAGGQSIGFIVTANDQGTITADLIPVFNPTPGQSVFATGIAIAKKGGW